MAYNFPGMPATAIPPMGEFKIKNPNPIFITHKNNCYIKNPINKYNLQEIIKLNMHMYM